MIYRKARRKGRIYFFTVVTHDRHKILCRDYNVELLREEFRHVRRVHPFKIDAFVLLPDHLHCIWSLPEDDLDFSTRWRLIKARFTRKCERGPISKPSESKEKKKEQAVWQRRFWEHLIKSDQDLKRHVEYIHYNPVKHGLVKAPKDWPYSSFHRYAREGVYPLDWGAGETVAFDEDVGNE